jgi:flagellum-specific peptidoglycan hydrolase FlgJ
MTMQEFIAEATAAARACSATSGLPPGISVAQAELESNFGESRLSREANNYFGIKLHKSIPEFVAMRTTEVLKGKSVQIVAKFAKYGSMQQCFADRDRIILHTSCYAEACAHAADPELFTTALAKPWATDPAYAAKLLHLYRANNFDRIDGSAIGPN